jgi:hypothetical protein
MKYLSSKYSCNYYRGKNRKLLPVIILTVILFITAAVFAGCTDTVSGKQNLSLESEEKELYSNEINKDKESEATNKEGSNSGQPDNSKSKSSNGKSGNSAQSDEKSGKNEKADDSELTVQEEKIPVLKPPALNLEIISGPELAQDNNICFYRIKAVVEGEPFPQVQFNRDDSNGAWGENIAQVNLLKGQSFTLTCSVSNTEGTAQSSVDVTWQEPGQSPEVTQVSSQTGYSDPSNYYIDVNLELQEVKVMYNGSTIRVMPCSGGLPETPTPLGAYKTNEKIYWAYVPRFEQGAYYWTRFYGSYLFHSVPHDVNKNMLLEEFAKIGNPASHGCIRLYLEDAKWMYESLPLGIEVNIHN